MRDFNLCDAFFSGFYFFREEFASSALGYLLSPFSTGTTAPLKLFIKKLLSTQNKYHILLASALEKLDSSENLTWEKSFVFDPLSCDSDVSSALEFKEIDLLLRVGEIIFLFENKIYDASVGNIGQQIAGYKGSLGKKWQEKIIPIAIFPRQAKSGFDDIISLSWNGSEDFTLGKFFKYHASQYPSLKDFSALIEADFAAGNRAALPERLSYDYLVNKFEEGFPEIIREVFPESNFAPGNDMNVGGCLLYRLPLPHSHEECFPFRLMVNGKCEILYQGLRKKIFLNGGRFDGKHTIRDIIKKFLTGKGITFDNRYYFSFRAFAKKENQEAFKEALDLLKRIDSEEWDAEKFFSYYNELNGVNISAARVKQDIQQLLDVDDSELEKNNSQLSELDRMIRAICAGRK